MSDTEDFTLPEEELSEGSPCPYCGSQLVLRHSDHGDFLGCTNYPDCSYLKPVSVSHSITVLGDVGAPCPVCGEPLQVKKGRFGIFIGCSNYPECTFVHNTQVREYVRVAHFHLCLKKSLRQVSGLSVPTLYVKAKISVKDLLFAHPSHKI